jgi:hypothetical protein
MRIALTLVMVCGCVTSGYQAEVDHAIARYAPSDRQIAAPTTLAATEWRVGQWAIYKARVEGTDAFESIRVVAKDGCGIWIQTVMHTTEGRSVWLVCFRDDLKMNARDRLRTAVGSDSSAAFGDGDGTRNFISLGVGVDLYLDLLKNR